MLSRKILIATPIYDGTVTIEYMISIRNTEAALAADGVSSDLRFLIGTEIWKSRNTFASIMLNNKEFSHLLFVDADMSFRPSAVVRLLASGKPICGCICPHRSMNLHEWHGIAREIDDPTVARNIAQPYVAAQRLEVVRHEDGYRFAVNDGFIRTAHIGCGVTLIERSVFEKMAEVMPHLVTDTALTSAESERGSTTIQCFSPMVDETGNFLSEDVSFCRRWTAPCHGEIWACVDEEIGHVGRNVYVGRASDRLSYHGVGFTTSRSQR